MNKNFLTNKATCLTPERGKEAAAVRGWWSAGRQPGGGKQGLQGCACPPPPTPKATSPNHSCFWNLRNFR